MMKRKACYYLLLILLFAGQTAHAQFWKRWFHHKEHKSEYRPRTTTGNAKNKNVQPQVKKKTEIEYPQTVIKRRYRIDVFAQLYLDELVKDDKPVYKGKVPDKAIPGLDFYEGIKLATDTLNLTGHAFDLYVHDVTDPLHTPEALIATHELDTSNLIIGAVTNKHIPALANFAKSKKINFVSAYSPSDAGVRDNPYFILIQPSLQSHCDWILSSINKKYKNKTPVVLYRTSVSQDSNAYNCMKISEWATKKLSLNNALTKGKIKPLLDSVNTNLVILPILDVNYAETTLKQLYEWFPGYAFEVYGMPSWKSMDALRKPDAFPNITVFVTSPFYFDYSTGPGQTLIASYKKEAGSSHPGDMVFRGYETMYWYAYLLEKYGTIFNKNFSDNAAAPFTKFDIKVKRDKDDNLYYQENKHIYLYKYQSSSYMIEQ
ncbi:MAG: hypothetical protein JST82_13650 [Bacteroidetes bacterium]|nr:hypothetical protein [Bacteroidota bacterium]